MMLANVYTKSVRDRYLGWIIGVASLLAMTYLGAFVYRDLDDFVLGMIDTLPESVFGLLGLNGVTGASSYMITAMFTTYGPFVVVGLAISMGVAAVAGEERNGTFEILQSNPVRRSSTVASKALGILTMIVIGSGATAMGMWLIGSALDLNLDSLHMTAAATHLAATALTYGLLALAVGAWSGNAPLASGISTGFLILSFFGAGVLPLIESLDWMATFFPWFYMSDGQPINNGIIWSDIGVLVAISVGLFALSVIGIRRRDIRSGESTRSLRDRMAGNKRLAGILAKLEGSGPSVSSIATKTFTESRVLMILVGMGVGYLALLEGPLYNLLDDVLVQFGNSFPDQLLAIIGVDDISTPEGWIGAEMFSIVAPAAAIVLGSSMGSRALGGEQDRGSMDLLLANPVSRTRVVTEKSIALVVALLGFGILTFLGTWAGIALGGLGIPVANLAAISTHLAALGLLFGGFALLIGAVTGRGKAAAVATAGLAILTYILNGFGTAGDRFGWLQDISPFGYYTGSDPLNNGLDFGDIGVLVIGSLVLIALAGFAFESADIRN